MRVSDGTRTRDILDHNQVLYHLSYTHHGPVDREEFLPRPAEKKCTGSEGVLVHGFARRPRSSPDLPRSAYWAGTTCFAAIFFAVSESGPGCGTKTASR